MEPNWPIRLFSKSVLKQTKYREITALLGPTHSLHCLDIGSDNGVISYLLRQRGGTWKSADLDERSVGAMAELVKENTYRIDGRRTPFAESEFDRVVIVDFLEHIHSDVEFMDELFRILKPDGELIINAPNIKNGPLVRFRNFIGLTDEDHGHVRPGYTIDSVKKILGTNFTVETSHTYTKTFSKFMDSLMVFFISRVKGSKLERRSGRGVLVTGKDLADHRAAFAVYSIIYPAIWLFSKLDSLLFFTSGYMLIAKARVNKETLTIGSSPAQTRQTSESVQIRNGQGVA